VSIHCRLEELLPNGEAESRPGGQLTTLHEAEAAEIGGDRLVVPASTKQDLASEFAA
jgi:hypothetical protein